MSRSLVRLFTISLHLPLICIDDSAAEAENRPKSAHRYNVAEQQQIYKSEVERIWKAQFDSLSRKDEPELTDDEDANKPPSPPAASPSFSRGSSLLLHDLNREGTLEPDARRVLRIKRIVNGEPVVEIVRDVAVIAAYVKKRQAIEEENMTTDLLAPTGDAERDKRAMKR